MNINEEDYFNDIIKDKQIKQTSSSENKLIDVGVACFDNSFDCFDLKFKNGFYFHNLTDESLYENSKPTPKFFEFYEKIAKSDVGLILTGGCCANVNKHARCSKKNVFIGSKENINYFNEFTKEIHTYGAKIFYTIKSKFGRIDKENKLAGVLSCTPAIVRNYHDSRVLTARFSDEKCNRLIDEFASMAKFAQETNFDGLVIDATINEILGEFSSGEFNKRKFGYFSDISDLSLKILSKINAYCNKFPIIYKINLCSFIHNIYNDIKTIKTLKRINNGLKFAHVLEFLTKLVQTGVDGFIFEFGVKETEFMQNFGPYQESFFYIEIYKEVRNHFENSNLRNKFNENVVLLLKDNIDDFSNVDHKNAIQFIDVTKNIYSNNNYLKDIKTQNIFKMCIKCNNCANISDNYGEISCTINPLLEYRQPMQVQLRHKKTIAIIGSGYSGISCALTLAKRGYSVDLYEQSSQINKNGKLLNVFGYDNYFNFYNTYLDEELKKYAKKDKINIKTNTKFTVNENFINNYSCIVVATGFHEKFLNVTGAVLKTVKTIYDVLSNKKSILNKKRIVIYAKTELSLKLGLYLSTLGKSVCIVINRLDFLFKMPNANLTYYLYAFKLNGVSIELMTQIRRIEEDCVELIINNKLKNKDLSSVILNMKSNNHYSYIAESKTIPADLFIYEPELSPNNKLYYELVNSNFKGELYMIGNALKIGDLGDDIKSGFYVGKNI